MTTTTTVDAGAGSVRVRRRPRIGLAAYAAASWSLTAALIHLKAFPEHFEEWWVFGAFFLACAVAQGLFAVLVLSFPHSRTILLGGIVGNVVIVLMYVITRTWGMPLGPDWRPFSPLVAHMEDPELFGIVATAAEVGVIIACLALLQGAYRRWTVNALLLVGVLLWAARLTGILP